jgi:hypothetical protein
MWWWSLLRELMEKYIEYVATTLQSIEPLLRPYGVKLEVKVLYRAPDECEDCVDHVIIIRLTCPENPDVCKELRETLQEELHVEPH